MRFLSNHYFRRILSKEKENYGDLLSKYIVEKVSCKNSKWYNPKTHSHKNLFAIGSILNLTNRQSIVWGSGIINSNDKVEALDFRAVRGPYTRANILNSGKNCPEIYGDPALLLPKFFNPQTRKKYRLGVIPHINDITIARKIFGSQSDIKIISLYTHDIESVTKEILECEKILSSSLHGIIVPHAYGIPAIFYKFSNNLIGDGVKFRDYFASVQIPEYVDENLKIANNEVITALFSPSKQPKKERIEYLSQGLLSSFPHSDF